MYFLLAVLKETGVIYFISSLINSTKMNKYWICFFITPFFILGGYTQSAKIIYTNGNAIHIATGKPIAKGEILQPGEVLKFFSDKDTVLMLVKGKGLGYYTPSADPRRGEKRTQEWQYLARDLGWVKKENGILGGRSGRLSSLSEVRQYFQRFSADSSAFLIIDSLEIIVAGNLAKDMDNGFLFVEYVKGSDTIQKKIKHNPYGDSKPGRIVLDTSLLRIDGIEGPGWKKLPVSIYFFDSKTGISRGITNAYISIISSGMLLPELCLLQFENDLPDASEIQSYLNWKYGNPDPDYFNIFNKNLRCN